jgi:hypothetical protein
MTGNGKWFATIGKVSLQDYQDYMSILIIT